MTRSQTRFWAHQLNKRRILWPPSACQPGCRCQGCQTLLFLSPTWSSPFSSSHRFLSPTSSPFSSCQLGRRRFPPRTDSSRPRRRPFPLANLVVAVFLLAPIPLAHVVALFLLPTWSSPFSSSHRFLSPTSSPFSSRQRGRRRFPLNRPAGKCVVDRLVVVVVEEVVVVVVLLVVVEVVVVVA
jgi:hypothetical protein